MSELPEHYKYMANFIRNVHFLVIIYLGLGPFITPDKYLFIHIFLIIIVLLFLNDSSRRCLLTRMEEYYKTGDWEQIKEKPQFFRPLLKNMLGIELPIEKADRMKIFIMNIFLLISFTRYYFTFQK